MDVSIKDNNEKIVIIRSSYTPAQKKAIYKYYANNKDKINKKRKENYLKKKEELKKKSIV